jgi:hypothetical protein
MIMFAEVHASVIADTISFSKDSHYFQFGGFVYLRDYLSSKSPPACKSISWFKCFDQVLETQVLNNVCRSLQTISATKTTSLFLSSSVNSLTTP